MSFVFLVSGLVYFSCFRQFYDFFFHFCFWVFLPSLFVRFSFFCFLLESSFPSTHRATMHGGVSISAIRVLLSGVWRRHVNYVYNCEMMFFSWENLVGLVLGLPELMQHTLQSVTVEISLQSVCCLLKCVLPLADGNGWWFWWVCCRAVASDLVSDISIEVDGHKFLLHKVMLWVEALCVPPSSIVPAWPPHHALQSHQEDLLTNYCCQHFS